MKPLAHFLYQLAPIVYISCNTAVAFYALPAYRRYKRPAFLLWFYSSLLGAFITVFDQTLGKTRMPGIQYTLYYDLREISYFIAVLLGVTGTLLFIKEYGESHTTRK